MSKKQKKHKRSKPDKVHIPLRHRIVLLVLFIVGIVLALVFYVNIPSLESLKEMEQSSPLFPLLVAISAFSYTFVVGIAIAPMSIYASFLYRWLGLKNEEE